jgi:hypothetical protein
LGVKSEVRRKGREVRRWGESVKKREHEDWGVQESRTGYGEALELR